MEHNLMEPLHHKRTEDVWQNTPPSSRPDEKFKESFPF